MRFDELSVQIPGDELRLRFHEHLTVLSGIGQPERQAIIDTILGALAGAQETTATLTYIDAQGRAVTVSRDAKGRATHTYEDGSRAPDIVGQLGLDVAALTNLIHLRPADVGLLASEVGEEESPELGEARTALAELNKQYEAALADHHAVQAMREELADVNARLRELEEGRNKRRYARLLGDLELVRAEAAVLRGGAAGAAADARLVEGAQRVPDLHERWLEATYQLRAAQERFGERERLDARTLAEAKAVPERVPAQLETLARDLVEAEARRDALTAHLSELAASRLPEPSDPAVVRLARVDQDAVWELARRAVDTGRRVEEESVALGGLVTDGMTPAIADELEQVHSAVESAEESLRRWRQRGVVATTVALLLTVAMILLMPLVAPLTFIAAVAAAYWGFVRQRAALAHAHRAEVDVLARAGVPTYRSFHLRRIDAVIDPNARERLHLAALEHRMTLGHWREVAGEVIDPARALAIEEEVRGYAAALAELDDAADEIETVRRELIEEAEPAAARTLQALLDACAPFGVDDPQLAVALVRHQVAVAHTARLQAQLEDAEATEARLQSELDEALSRLSVDEGDVDARLEALARTRQMAEERQRARARCRPADQVEAELAELEARVRAEHRVEWGTSVTPADGAEPDGDELLRRRNEVDEALQAAEPELADIERLADRRGAVERRVAVLEIAMGDALDASLLVGTDDIENLLISRMIEARNAGRTKEDVYLETIPVLLDEPFLRIRGEKKWEVLDLVERLSGKIQVVYLTDDPDVVVWSRRRLASGRLTLLEPVSEPVA